MSRLHRLVLGSGCGALGYAAASPEGYASVAQLVSSVASSLNLSALIPAPAQGAVAATGAAVVGAAANAQELQAELLKDILQTLAAQRSPSVFRTMLTVAAPIACGVAAYYLGWHRFGWVTMEQLHEGLAGVREAVVGSVQSLGDSLRLRFEHVDARLSETAQTVTAIGAATEELTAKVQAVSETMTSLERRMAPIEENAATAAKGVEVLCALVHSSNLLANASPDSLSRLDEFTQNSSREGGASSRELPPPASRPELMGPAPTSAPPVPVAALPDPALSQAAPTFMRALIDPQPSIS